MPRRKTFRPNYYKKPTLPKIFTCPSCGNRSVSVKIERNKPYEKEHEEGKIVERKDKDGNIKQIRIKIFVKANIKCSMASCEINNKKSNNYELLQNLPKFYEVSRLFENVDVFGLFTDDYQNLMIPSTSKKKELKWADMDKGFLED